MQTKLTLRIEDSFIDRAKDEAAKRGKSVSELVAEFFDSLGPSARIGLTAYAPITSSLLGVLQKKRSREVDYKRHLRTKHL